MNTRPLTAFYGSSQGAAVHEHKNTVHKGTAYLRDLKVVKGRVFAACVPN